MLDKFLTEVLKLAPWQMHGVDLQRKYLKKAFTSGSLKTAITCLIIVAELIGNKIDETGRLEETFKIFAIS